MSCARRRMALLIACCLPAMAQGAPVHLDRIQLPPGFRIAVYAQDVPNVRSKDCLTRLRVIATKPKSLN